MAGSKAHMTQQQHMGPSSEREGKTETRTIRQRQTSNHTKVKLDKLQYVIHYSSKLRSMHCLA